MAPELEMDKPQKGYIRLAGMLHDIGHYPLSHNIEAAYKEGYQEVQNGRRSVLEQQKDLVGCPSYLAAGGESTDGKKLLNQIYLI